jgi:hypothetical protein
VIKGLKAGAWTVFRRMGARGSGAFSRAPISQQRVKIGAGLRANAGPLQAVLSNGLSTFGVRVGLKSALGPTATS